MKKIILSILSLIVGISAFAQMNTPFPTDQKVRIGKLDNGLTYYIRHNNYPEKQVDFYIAQKVGSILEEDDQSGLAHFLEHMCFNGTKNFPGKSLISYLEGIGVKFGENLNAYTSIDETVYNISNVRANREGVVDSCLLILHDWSDGLTLDPKEIDAERGVIREEWRTRSNPTMRMIEKAMPTMLQNSKYAYRLPIGKMDVIANFKYKALRDYYEKWYRPNLQGLIIVGDIDVDKVEAKIKSLFSAIKNPPNETVRNYIAIPDNKETIVSIVKDKEQTLPIIQLFYKYDTTPAKEKASVDYYATEYMKSMIIALLNNRLQEIKEKPDAPFLTSSVGDAEFLVAKTKRAFTATVVCKENKIEEGFVSMLKEVERVRKFGFTSTEYERAKSNYITQVETSYKERNKTPNSTYANEYVRSFIDDEPIPGIEFEYNLYKTLASQISINDINQMAATLADNTNQVILSMCPDKDGFNYPTKQLLLDCFKKTDSNNLTKYEDKVTDEPLLEKLPIAGKIVKEANGIYNSTVLYLSNGAKVIVKPTDFKADEINFTAFSPGGSSLFTKDCLINIVTLNEVANLGGTGNFDRISLMKKLTGKRVGVNLSIGNRTETGSGSCSNDDFETMLQLLYLKFTSPRMDAEAFESYKERLKISLEKRKGLPKTEYSDSIQKALYNGHPLAKSITPDMVDKIDYNRIMEMYKDRFKDASDFTFVFVGNIDLEKAKPLFETYIGSLPSINRKEKAVDNKMYYRKGEYKNIFSKKMETPKSSVMILVNGKCEYNQKNLIKMNILSQSLNSLYLEEIREKESGTYGVNVNASLVEYPKPTASITINFDTNSELREKMTNLIIENLHKFSKEGPSKQNLDKFKEFMFKNHKERLKNNGYWMNILTNYYQNNIDMFNNYEEIVSLITSKDIQTLCKNIVNQNNNIEVTMCGE